MKIRFLCPVHNCDLQTEAPESLIIPDTQTEDFAGNTPYSTFDLSECWCPVEYDEWLPKSTSLDYANESQCNKHWRIVIYSD